MGILKLSQLRQLRILQVLLCSWVVTLLIIFGWRESNIYIVDGISALISSRAYGQALTVQMARPTSNIVISKPIVAIKLTKNVTSIKKKPSNWIRSKAQSYTWDVPNYDPDFMLFFFVHIPLTGGTAVSWHIMGSLAKYEDGAIVPGSAASGRFQPRELIPKKGRSGSWDRRWLYGANATDGTSLWKAAFGHNRISDEAFSVYGGKSLVFGTMLRKRQYKFKAQKPFICNHFAKRFAPWWLGDDQMLFNINTEENRFTLPDVESWKRPSAPVEIREFCTGAWRRRPPAGTRPSHFPQTKWIAEGHQFPEGYYLSTAFRYSPEDAAVLETLVRDGHRIIAHAAHTLIQMPWFGIHEHWAASLCLLHSVTKWPWPYEHQAACGGSDVQSWNFSSYTKGPAALAKSKKSSSDKKTKKPLGSQSHMGSSPSRQNNMACCPIRVAEKMVEFSATRSLMLWLDRKFQNISEMIDNASQRPRLLSNKPYGENYSGLFFGLNPAAHANDDDETVISWAESIFRYRFSQEARNLAREGYSSDNVPPYLSPDCFAENLFGGQGLVDELSNP